MHPPQTNPSVYYSGSFFKSPAKSVLAFIENIEAHISESFLLKNEHVDGFDDGELCLNLTTYRLAATMTPPASFCASQKALAFNKQSPTQDLTQTS